MVATRFKQKLSTQQQEQQQQLQPQQRSTKSNRRQRQYTKHSTTTPSSPDKLSPGWWSEWGLLSAAAFFAVVTLRRYLFSPTYYTNLLFDESSNALGAHNQPTQNKDRQPLPNTPVTTSQSPPTETTKLSFVSFGAQPILGPKCTQPTGNDCVYLEFPSISDFSGSNIYTCDHQCSSHAICYFGSCLCHPGYAGESCQEKMQVANPWYTADCPNLQAPMTLDISTQDYTDPAKLGGIVDCPDGLSEGLSLGTGLSYCAYLCYSNKEYGTAIVPKLLWEKAQEAENKLWKQVGQRTKGNDRYKDHFQGFANYMCLPDTANLGHVLEVGAGPWTQFRGLLHNRPNVHVDSFTILEPGADFYLSQVGTCAYQTGKLAQYPDTTQFYDFPIHIQSKLGGKHHACSGFAIVVCVCEFAMGCQLTHPLPFVTNATIHNLITNPFILLP